MKNTPSQILRSLASAAPTLLTLAALAGIAYVGHLTGWKMPAAKSLVSSEKPEKADWCMEHGVPESACLICRGRTPTPDETGSPLVLDPADAMGENARRPVQFASAEAVAQSGVTTAVATTQRVDHTVSAPAEVRYNMTRYAPVAPRVSGSIMMVRAETGQKVAAGEVLAIIDSAQVGAAKASLLQAAARVASSEQLAERLKASTSAGFRNQSDLIEAEATLREARIALFNARQALINLGLPAPAMMGSEVPSERDVQFLGLASGLASELDPTRTTANLIPLSSAIDGIVVSRSAVPGEVVDSSRALFVVADTSEMWVTADLTPADAARVAIGQTMRFQPEGGTGEPVSGRVSWVSTEVDERTRTVQVRAVVPNPDGKLLANTFGRASIVLETDNAAVVVPSGAVQWDGRAHVVFVRVNSEVFAPRVVTLGPRAGEVTQILRGVRSGEAVAVSGSYVLVAQMNRDKLGAGCTDD